VPQIEPILTAQDRGIPENQKEIGAL